MRFLHMLRYPAVGLLMVSKCLHKSQIHCRIPEHVYKNRNVLKKRGCMQLLISGVSTKEDKMIAHILFKDGKNYAEGTIPDCRITKQEGFTDDEVSQLEDYLRANLTSLKKEAAKINPIKAMMK